MAYLGGIKDMRSLPDMIFVVDAVRERIAIQEAQTLGIPVIAPLDTNCNPDVIEYPIPGNDDAIRSISLFCKEVSEAIIEGRASIESEEVINGEVVKSENDIVVSFANDEKPKENNDDKKDKRKRFNKKRDFKSRTNKPRDFLRNTTTDNKSVSEKVKAESRPKTEENNEETTKKD